MKLKLGNLMQTFMENGNREMPGSWKHKSHKAAAPQRNAQLSPTSNGAAAPNIY